MKLFQINTQCPFLLFISISLDSKVIEKNEKYYNKIFNVLLLPRLFS